MRRETDGTGAYDVAAAARPGKAQIVVGRQLNLIGASAHCLSLLVLGNDEADPEVGRSFRCLGVDPLLPPEGSPEFSNEGSQLRLRWDLDGPGPQQTQGNPLHRALGASDPGQAAPARWCSKLMVFIRKFLASGFCLWMVRSRRS